MTTNRPILIAVDFDNTIVLKEKYPLIGELNPGCVHWLNKIRELVQHAPGQLKLILWTCRFGQGAIDAYNFCAANGILIDAIAPVNPWDRREDELKQHQSAGPKSVLRPKPKVDVFVDDHCLGIPVAGDDPMDVAVDWAKAGPLLYARVRELAEARGYGRTPLAKQPETSSR